MTIYEKMLIAPTTVRTFVKVTDEGGVFVYYDGMGPSDLPIAISPGRVLQIDTRVEGTVNVPVRYTVSDETLPRPHAPSIVAENPYLAAAVFDP